MLRMPKSKVQKQETIKELNDNLDKARSIVFVDIQGLKVNDLVVLRKKVKEARGVLKVAKKSLIDIVLKGKKEIGDNIRAKGMAGEIAMLFSLEDPLQPLKSLYSFSKEHENLKFVAGVFDNLLLQKEEVLQLAQLPSKEELLEKLIGSIFNPVSGFVNVLQGNIKGLITVLAKAKT